MNRLAKVLLKIREEKKITIVVEYVMRFIMGLSDHIVVCIVVILQGRKIAEGSL